MTVDFTEVTNRLQNLLKKAGPDAASKGLFKAANELLHDAIYQVPIAPFDLGALRGSARVYASSGMYEAQMGEPPAGVQANKSGDELWMLAGFFIVYAARWHELSPAKAARVHWTTPGSGRKYLESKMPRNAAKYRDIVGKAIENLLRG